MPDPEDDSLNEGEIERRRDAALLRALSTPHKRQKEMKLGKRGKKERDKDAPGSATPDSER